MLPLSILSSKDGGRVITKDVGYDARLGESGDTDGLYVAALGRSDGDDLACFDNHALHESGHVPAHEAPG